MARKLSDYQKFRDYVFRALRKASRGTLGSRYFTPTEVARCLNGAGFAGYEGFVLGKLGLGDGARMYHSNVQEEVLSGVDAVLMGFPVSRSHEVCEMHVDGSRVFRYVRGEAAKGASAGVPRTARDRVLDTLKGLTERLGEFEPLTLRYFSPGEVAREASVSASTARRVLKRLAEEGPEVDEIRFGRVNVSNVGPNGVKHYLRYGYRHDGNP